MVEKQVLICHHINRKTELTKDIKHKGRDALSYLVGGGADVLSIVSSGDRPYGQLAAVWVKIMTWVVSCHRPGRRKEQNAHSVQLYRICFSCGFKRLRDAMPSRLLWAKKGQRRERRCHRLFTNLMRKFLAIHPLAPRQNYTVRGICQRSISKKYFWVLLQVMESPKGRL